MVEVIYESECGEAMIPRRYIDPDDPKIKIARLEQEKALLQTNIDRVVALCESRMTYITFEGTTQAERVDYESLWPSEVLNALREAR